MEYRGGVISSGFSLWFCKIECGTVTHCTCECVVGIVMREKMEEGDADGCWSQP